MKPTALTTLANLKSELKITTTSEDARLERLIDSASSWIETQTNRKLKARRYNGLTGGAATLGAHPTTLVSDEDYLYFSGSTLDQGGDTLYDSKLFKGIYHLPQYPVQVNDEAIVVFGLHVLTARDASGETWDTTGLVEWRDYVVERSTGRILLSGPFAYGYRNYRVKMSAGFRVGDNEPFVPEDLETLCIELVKDAYGNRSNIQSETIGTWSRSFDTKKSKPFVTDTLDKYRSLTI